MMQNVIYKTLERKTGSGLSEMRNTNWLQHKTENGDKEAKA